MPLTQDRTMNPSLRRVLFALLDTEADPDTGKDLSSAFSVDSFTKESRDLLQRRFSRFVDKAEDAVRKIKGDDWASIDEFYTGSGVREGSFEHAYILTVNHRDAGFSGPDWDAEVGAALAAICRQEEKIDIEIWTEVPACERGYFDEELNIYTADIQPEEA